MASHSYKTKPLHSLLLSSVFNPTMVPATDDKKKHMIRVRVGVSHPAAWYINGIVTMVAPIELLSCKQKEPAKDIFFFPKAFRTSYRHHTT